MTKNRPKRRLLFWAVLCIVCSAIAALPYLPWLAEGWIPRIQAVQPWLLSVVGLTLILLLLRKHWQMAAIMTAALIVGILPTVQPNHGEAVSSKKSNELRIMSFNAGKAGADPAQLAAVVHQADPDVLVLVETSEPLNQAIEKHGALEHLGFRSAEVPTGEQRDTVIFSRYQLTERADALSPRVIGWYGFPVVDIESPAGMIGIVGVHVYPPTDNGRRWQRGLAALDRWVEQQGEKQIVLAGDFNATRTHPQFRKLAHRLSPEATLWPVNTWPAAHIYPPMMGIDHILAGGMKVADTHAIQIDGSDHLALSATVVSLG